MISDISIKEYKAIEDRVRQETLAEVEKMIDESDDYVEVGSFKEDKVYIDNPSEAPKGATIKKGPRGGMYYDVKPETGIKGEEPEQKEPGSEQPRNTIPYDVPTPEFKKKEPSKEPTKEPKGEPESEKPKVDAYEYQDKNQEEVIHSGWKKGNSYRYVLEGTGDIFRELTKSEYPHYSYIGEKIDRIEKHIEESETMHPEDSYKYSYENNKDKFDKMIKLWEEQPTENELQDTAKKLNIAMLNKDFGKAQEYINTIKKAFEKKDSSHESIELPIEKGDVILGGKWRNKKIVVKDIGEKSSQKLRR